MEIKELLDTFQNKLAKNEIDLGSKIFIEINGELIELTSLRITSERKIIIE